MSVWTSNPGSPAATANGCICAVMDNCRGAGRGGDGERWGWYVTGGCPLHAPLDEEVGD